MKTNLLIAASTLVLGSLIGFLQVGNEPEVTAFAHVPSLTADYDDDFVLPSMEVSRNEGETSIPIAMPEHNTDESSDLAKAASLLTTATDSPQQQQRFIQFMHEWAGKDPKQAVEFWQSDQCDDAISKGCELDEQFYQIAFRGWAKTSFEGAVSNLRAPDTALARIASLSAVAQTVHADAKRFSWLLDNPPAGAEWTPTEKATILIATGRASEAAVFSSAITPEERAILASGMPK